MEENKWPAECRSLHGSGPIVHGAKISEITSLPILVHWAAGLFNDAITPFQLYDVLKSQSYLLLKALTVSVNYLTDE